MNEIELSGILNRVNNTGINAVSAMKRRIGDIVLRFEPLALAVLAASIGGHLLCLPLLNHHASLNELAIVLEVKILIGISLGGSFAALFIGKRPYFLVAHYFRLAMIVIVIAILGESGLAINLLLINLFIVDTAIYEPIRPAVIGILAVIALLLLYEVLSLTGADVNTKLIHFGLTALSSGLTGGGFVLVTFFREKAVIDERTISDLNNAFDRLTTSNLGLQSYAADVENTSAQNERNRITRELHDSVGYAMTNIAMTMNASKVLIKSGNEEKLTHLIENTRETANKCLQETRSTLYKLRTIDDPRPVGLNALSHLSKVYSEATSIQVVVEYGNTVQSYGEEIDSVVYRFVQEALTNAFRHSKAQQIRIRVLLRQEGNKIIVRVWDNGSGMQEIKEGIGLKGMRERIEQVRGKVEYANVADGFKIWTTIPFTEEPDE